MARPLIGEYCPCCLVVAIPLDRPAPVQKVFVGVVAPESQEISSFSHFLDTDIPGPLGYQSDVNVSWKKRKTESAESYIVLLYSFIVIKSSKWFSKDQILKAFLMMSFMLFYIFQSSRSLVHSLSLRSHYYKFIITRLYDIHVLLNTWNLSPLRVITMEKADRNIPSPSLSSNVLLTVVQVEPSPLQTPHLSSTALDSTT